MIPNCQAQAPIRKRTDDCRTGVWAIQDMNLWLLFCEGSSGAVLDHTSDVPDTEKDVDGDDNEGLYSKISPGWQSKALQIASKVDSRMARAFPFFNMEILAIVMPTFSASSVTLIFRFANITSMFMIIAMIVLLHG